ncbi:hypothetical protein LQ564_08925 [Massilia sp. G4R7]|uniref:Uncharacterized protein n=1 Tax=Massilia phyllostachyos TaxID=2898585 RepID=A0ABS8Q3V7_9BURK|nr:hypothetical protein [Massilia phyllostachyos]MCD2516432.1 hypothetical protein [Massilia phyllostachyos]
MFTMILLLYLQQHRDVMLESTSLKGSFQTKKACEAAAVRLRGPLPTPDGYAAAWHDAICIPVNRGVIVNEGKPVDLGALLKDRPPVVCEGTGAWRRVAELCAPASSSGSKQNGG